MKKSSYGLINYDGTERIERIMKLLPNHDLRLFNREVKLPLRHNHSNKTVNNLNQKWSACTWRWESHNHTHL